MTTLTLQQQHGFSFVQKMQSVLAILSLWMQRYQQRKQLAQLDARLLRDVGLSHEQVRAEINKPFWK